MNTANNAWNENIALSNEAGKRYATTESKLAMLDNAYSNLQVAIGDVYTPALRNAADLGIVVLEGITGFVEENPAAVRAFTALGIGVGAFAVALGGYVVASKAAAVATRALTAAMNANPYLLAGAAIIGVVSAVASLAVTAEHEAVPAVEELTATTQEMMETMDEASALYDSTVSSTLATVDVADRYINKLEELEAAGRDTKEAQVEYHNTLALLTQLVPELAGMINLETDAITGGTAALRANTDAWAENAKQQAYNQLTASMQEGYNAIMVEACENSIELTKATDDLAAAQKRRNNISARMKEIDDIFAENAKKKAEGNYEECVSTEGLTEEYYELSSQLSDACAEVAEAETRVETYRDALDANNAALEETEAEMAEMAEAWDKLNGATSDGAELTEEAAAQVENIEGKLASVNSEILSLAENYQLSYTAAQESISGQYAIWDEAANVIPTRVSTINRALEDQASYWTDYSANLETLNEKAANIDGLSEMVASFADGSAESVNAIAGMAAASEEELTVMVENWQAVKEAEDTAAQGVADLSTGFSNACDDMAQDIADFVEDANLGEEAKTAAIATMQGYIDGATMMLPQVQAAYANVGTTMAEAMGMPGAITVPTGRGYASGTTNAERGFAMVGEEGPEIVYFNGGEQVLNARETAAIRNAPLEPTMPLMAATVPDQTSNGKPMVSLQVNYEITSSGVEDLKTQMDYSAEHLRTVVRQVMDEYADDVKRRAYR